MLDKEKYDLAVYRLEKAEICLNDAKSACRAAAGTWYGAC